MFRADGTEVDIMDVDEEYIMYAHLFEEGGEKHIETVEVPISVGSDQQGADVVGLVCRNPLIGSSGASPHRVKDPNEEQVTVFCFSDLKTWIAGRFCLRFALFHLPKKDTPHSSPTSFLATVMSKVFTVYTAKEFPGVYESTALSKKLSIQGVSISIRNKNRLKNNDEDSGTIMEVEYSNNNQDA
ncbi:hypothetical protein FBU31_005013 [Coemansia sp. 'formosensis']|nr:hypothetical protein FBU31_005013 [Coemansia sp. 'formosensis']